MPSSPTSRIDFPHLPPDIHHLIIQQLMPLCGPIFDPSRLGRCYTNSLAPSENVENCGRTTDDQFLCSQGLLNWSSTCWYFRRLIFPMLLETVVLVSKKKSVESMKVLSRTEYWSFVEHLIFVGTYQLLESLPEPDILGEEHELYREHMLIPGIQGEMNGLVAMLSNLPPNLTSLTLDFPWSWKDLRGMDDSDYEWYQFEADEYHNIPLHVRSARTFRLKQTSRYQILLYVIFDTISRHFASKKSQFDLRLRNIPPFYSSIYEQKIFSTWLKQCKSFSLAWYHFQAQPSAVSYVEGEEFAEKLDQWFLKHLDNTEDFRLHTVKAFPFNCLGFGYEGSEFSLPATLEHLAMVKHVSLKAMLVGPAMKNFLVARASRLVSIELIDCFAAGAEISFGPENNVTWAYLFNAMSCANFEKLTSFVVRSEEEEPGPELYERLPWIAEDIDLINEMMQEQQEKQAMAYEEGATTSDVLRRRRQIFPYCSADASPENVRNNVDLMFAYYLMGKDFAAYLRVIETVEANMTREGLAFFVMSSTSPRYCPRAKQICDDIYRIWSQ